MKNCIDCMHATPVDEWEKGVTSRNKPFSKFVCPIAYTGYGQSAKFIAVKYRDGCLFTKYDPYFIYCHAWEPRGK